MQEAAFGIIFDKTRKKILLVKRRDVPIWVLPGGGIDCNESPRDAAIREIKEETGLQCTAKRHIALYKAQGHFVSNTYVFELEVLSKSCSPLKTSNETAAIGFFDISSLPTPFFPVHGLWIQDALRENKEAIVKPLEGVSFKTITSFLVRHPLLFFLYILSKCFRLGA